MEILHHGVFMLSLFHFGRWSGANLRYHRCDTGWRLWWYMVRSEPASTNVSPKAELMHSLFLFSLGTGMSTSPKNSHNRTRFLLIGPLFRFCASPTRNRYPNAQCDVESYIYAPLTEEIGFQFSEKYAHQPELFAHAQLFGKHFDLYSKALFQTEVTQMTWNSESGRWLVETNRGDRLQAKFVILGTGLLQKIKLPSVPGIGVG